jgi:hypothetical protein
MGFIDHLMIAGEEEAASLCILTLRQNRIQVPASSTINLSLPAGKR